MTYNLCFARTLYNYTLYFPYFIGQDRNKMKYTYTVKRKEELMPKREGHKRDTWTHAGCPPRGNVWRHTGFLSLHLFVSFFSVCLFPFRIFVFTKLLMLLNLPECHFPHLFFREIWKKFQPWKVLDVIHVHDVCTCTSKASISLQMDPQPQSYTMRYIKFLVINFATKIFCVLHMKLKLWKSHTQK